MITLSDELRRGIDAAAHNGNELAIELKTALDEGRPTESDSSWDINYRSFGMPMIQCLSGDRQEWHSPSGWAADMCSELHINRHITPAQRQEFEHYVRYPQKLTYKIVTTYDDIYRIYYRLNWCTTEGRKTSGWQTNRHAIDFAQCYAKFYTECVKDCRVIGAFNEAGQVIAWSVIWDKAFLSRCNDDYLFDLGSRGYYFPYLDGIEAMNAAGESFIKRMALKEGAKIYNDGIYRVVFMDGDDVTEDVHDLMQETCKVSIKAHIPKDWKFYVPYYSRFRSLMPGDAPDEYIMSTLDSGRSIWRVSPDHRVYRSTEFLCPKCGCRLDDKRCEKCGWELPIIDTYFGRVYAGKTVQFDPDDDYEFVPEVYLNEDGTVKRSHPYYDNNLHFTFTFMRTVN